jgi:sortase B
MFGDLDFYRWNHEYWKSNPIIHFDTLFEERDYVIIASFVTNEDAEDDNGNRFDYQNYIYFNDDWAFESWKEELMLRTQFFTGVDFDENDQYITLSTCSTEWEPSRHVIVARLLHDGEEVDVDKWEDNPNPKMPQIWYDLYGGDGWDPDDSD